MGIFSIDPPYFGYNSAGQKTLFPIFLSFRALPGLKLTGDFWSINILSRETPGKEEVKKNEAQGPNGPKWRSPLARLRNPRSFGPRASNIVNIRPQMLSLT
jgi:hypothetical protein